MRVGKVVSFTRYYRVENYTQNTCTPSAYCLWYPLSLSLSICQSIIFPITLVRNSESPNCLLTRCKEEEEHFPNICSILPEGTIESRSNAIGEAVFSKRCYLVRCIPNGMLGINLNRLRQVEQIHPMTNTFHYPPRKMNEKSKVLLSKKIQKKSFLNFHLSFDAFLGKKGIVHVRSVNVLSNGVFPSFFTVHSNQI